jgi:hypothetical protein
MVDKLGNTKNAQLLHVLARSCTLAPNSVAPADRVVVWAKQAEDALDRFRAGNAPAYYLHAVGAAHYRAGDFEAAGKSLRISMKRDKTWPGNVMNGIFLAMTYHKLGKAELAQEWLDKTDQWLQDARKKIDDEPYGFPRGIYPADWLITQALRREAEAMMKSDAKKGA